MRIWIQAHQTLCNGNILCKINPTSTGFTRSYLESPPFLSWILDAWPFGLPGGSQVPKNYCQRPKLPCFVSHEQKTVKLSQSREFWQHPHCLPCYKYISKTFWFHFVLVSQLDLVNFAFGLLAAKAKSFECILLSPQNENQLSTGPDLVRIKQETCTRSDPCGTAPQSYPRSARTMFLKAYGSASFRVNATPICTILDRYSFGTLH